MAFDSLAARELVDAIVEELLAGDLVVVDGVDANLFERDSLARSLAMALLACHTSDLWMTGTCPAVSLPSPSTEMMPGAYIVRITSKFFPWLHRSANSLTTV